MKLIGDDIELKKLSEDFFYEYLQMFSEIVQKSVAATQEGELGYLHAQLEKQKNGKTFFLCIFEKTTQRLIGAIEIRSKAYRGQLYNWVNELYWGSGFYQEAFYLAVQAYFGDHPDEDHFNAWVDVSNKRSLKALQKLGCTVEGVRSDVREDQYEVICKKQP